LKEGHPTLAVGGIFAFLRLGEGGEHFCYDLDMIGYFHFFLGLELGYVLLEPYLLPVVVAASVGRGKAVIGPIFQRKILSRGHITKFYYK
jgi:hypothetical protein